MRKAILASSAAVAFLALAACDGQAPPPEGNAGSLNTLVETVAE